jgi:hypothetical protein
MAQETAHYRDEVEQVQRRFAEWRSTHAVRSRLPEELWAAGEFPVSVRDCSSEVADTVCQGREAPADGTGNGALSGRRGAGATAICGVAKHACGAVAAAGRVVGSSRGVGPARWDRCHGAGAGCG